MSSENSAPPDSPLISLTGPAVSMSVTYSLLPSLNRYISEDFALRLNAQVLHQDHFCNSRYQPHTGSEIYLYPSHSCFQVFSYFSNIIWLPNYQHHVEKHPEKKFKKPQGTQYLPLLISVFLFSPRLYHLRKLWKGLMRAY